MAAKEPKIATLDGNEAAAYVAYRVNEVCAIYPITPSSTMSELSDEWASAEIKNIWGNIPVVIEMQSEGGAAGTVHGALQTGSLTTTFTSSQGLMLMLPNMYKIAGELTATVFHVAARSLAAQGLSIFGDHQDVMAARPTGFAFLCSASVQEAHDLSLISQAATLKSRVPFLHFFDGFRTSHEVNKLELLSDEQIKEMIPDELVFAHRNRALNPDKPFIRGTAQNPDVYFQGRETVNPFISKTPTIVEETMQTFEKLTGRKYNLFDYTGARDATRVIIIMGSGGETVIETVKALSAKGEKIGAIQVRLYRPFSLSHFITVLPETTESIAVLDRTKEPGASGEPLYQDVLTCLIENLQQGSKSKHLPKVIGGRYGLSSKEFTPAMVKAIFDELKKENPKNHFTIGINDDVSHTSLDYDSHYTLDESEWKQALFFGLGADGTVGANKNTIKIIGENTKLYAQGYFVYDSKKSGARTVSHLRFGPKPIRAPYLISKADFIASHQFNFVNNVEMLHLAKEGATFLLNSPYSKEEIWDKLPHNVQKQIIHKKLRVYFIDATSVAKETGMGSRINTIMQTCYFALSEVLPREEAIAQIKKAIEKTYSKKGSAVIEKNFHAVDSTLENLYELKVPNKVTAEHISKNGISHAPDFVKNVTALMMADRGEELSVSMLPVDGTYPSGTTKWEKRNVSDSVPVWDADSCIQCGNCAYVCPHAVIRAKFYNEKFLSKAPPHFKSAPINSRGFPETKYSLQVYVEDCTGCNLCVEACPAINLLDNKLKAINMHEKEPILETEKKNIKFFEDIPWNDRSKINFSTVHGAQFLEPLFEFSGACAGCGETPYLKLLSQLFGDRLLVANATGCSSIYGGNLPTTPWSVNQEGKGPAWSNSLFEDNAEFGLGMRITADKQLGIATDLLHQLTPELGKEFVDSIIGAPQALESEIIEQRRRVTTLKKKLLLLRETNQYSSHANHLLSVADQLVGRSVWLVGGDGWAYDIGYGGLDHALSTGRNINILVLDTEVYSNTGGQASKSTPTAATAKFASSGKRIGKKDLAMQAISYGNVYVARVALGANPQQTLLAMREAEAYNGPSLILAYSPCIAHGYDLKESLDQQHKAVTSGHWPLIRYNPVLRKKKQNPFVLDSVRPVIALKEYALHELRYSTLTRSHPKEAEELMKMAQELVNLRWKNYEELATLPATDFVPVA